MLSAIRLLIEPGSLSLLVLALAAGTLALRLGPRVRLAARAWLAAWALLYLALSLPIVAGGLVQRLGDAPPLAARPGLPSVIVVLASAGDWYDFAGEPVPIMDEESTLRITEAARLFRATGATQVIASGTDRPSHGTPVVPAALRAGLAAAGVPAGRILLEDRSTDTHESARAVRAILADRGVTRVTLVTSSTHMRRSARVFRLAGLDVVEAPAPSLPRYWPTGWQAFQPKLSALRISAACLHEYVGLAYYTLRGWA
ncbi:MAG: YdcF family protein [Vicinamibacterales bacterium]